jgi:transcriptional regulator with XRE-family HTH domain
MKDLSGLSRRSRRKPAPWERSLRYSYFGSLAGVFPSGAKFKVIRIFNTRAQRFALAERSDHFPLSENPAMSIEVATRLQYIRKKNGLSQRELAKRAGVTNGTISLIEQNRVSPSVGSLKKLLECIPMSLAEFFTFEVEVERLVVSRRADMPNLGNESIEFYLAGSSV